MADLPARDVERANFVFSIYDFEGVGVIDCVNLGDCLRALNLNPTVAAIEKLGGTKKKNEKKMKIDEFLPIFSQVKKDKDCGGYADFLECLKLYDKEENGKMMSAELSHTLLSIGENLEDKQVDEVLADCMDAEDEDGFIPYDPFIKKLMADTSFQGAIQSGGTNGPFPIRPPLARLESRATLLQTPPQGSPQQPRPAYPINPQQGPPQFRPPLQQLQSRSQFPGGQPFVQRPPQPRINFPQGQRSISPSSSPLPQPYLQRPQGTLQPRNPSARPFLPQQQSLSGAAPVPRPFYQAVLRARTLDSTNESQIKQEFTPRDESAKSAAMASMKNRSFSVANAEPSILMTQHDTRRMSASSVGSNDAAEIAKPTTNGKINSTDLPPRPESRTNSAAMTKIEERVATPEKIITAPPAVQNIQSDVTDLKKLPPKPGGSSKDTKPDVKDFDLKSPTKSEGDNDSGVDESTQGNESNGERTSPRKPTGLKSGRSTATPTKLRSLSRGGKSPNPLSPNSTPSTPGATDKKKLPMNKIQVGSAPSPNLKVVKSKIGSLQNTTHKPGGGNVKIEHKKIDVSCTTSKVTAKNDTYIPGGGDKKIPQQKLQWNVKSKIGSLDNAQHKPKGGDKKIESVKLAFKDKAKPKVGSKDNIKHIAGGGDIKSETVTDQSPNAETIIKTIENKKIDLNVQSKVGSFENVKHKAGGGAKKIFDDKEYLKQMSAQEIQKSLSTSQNSIPSSSDPKEPISDENLNREN